MIKKILPIFIIVLLLISTNAYCQKKASDDFSINNYENFAKEQAGFLKDSLHLTIAQEGLVLKVYADLLEGLLNVRSDSTVSIQSRSVAIKKLMDKKDAGLITIFSQEQYEKYKAIINWRNSIKQKRH